MSQILIIGATGLLGSHLAASLAAQGHEIIGAARSVVGMQRAMPSLQWIEFDISEPSSEKWEPLFLKIDVIINCAGALQDGPRDDLFATHATGLLALVEACERAALPRIIHFSAMGVDQATPTAFSRSKLAGDQALIASRLSWVILRPSVVLGSSAYGASSLIRGLASLPVLPVMPETGQLRPVALADIVDTVSFFIRIDAPDRVAIDISGPQEFEFSAVVRLHREWLGHRPAIEIMLPAWLSVLLYRSGDMAALLGWRPPLRSTARLEVQRGAAADNSEWRRLTGIHPRRISDLLNATPASVQEKWFAGLYLLKPVILISLAVFWLGSGIASLGPGYGSGTQLLHESTAGWVAPLLVISGGLADIAIGIGISIRRTARGALLGGALLSILYAVAGSVLTPWLWLDPLASLLKIAPVLSLHLVALAVLRDR